MMRTRNTLACWLCLIAGLTMAAVLVASQSASAAWPPVENPDAGATGGINYADPMNWPNDPGYQGRWQYWSFVPKAWQPNVTDENKRLGTGAHVDRAWARTTGDRRVLIAEIDSGCNWSNGDLVNKFFLNPGELPPPMGCPGSDGKKYDVNGDGVFNVQDYTTATGHQTPAFTKVCDPRVLAKGDGNTNQILDPQDLIVTFSDGKDDDGDGYIDNISGWDFFRNDNDPFDDIGYGHGNGSQSDAVAEGNNGMGGIGACPDCTVESLRLSDTYVYDGSTFAMGLLYAVDSGASFIHGEGASITNGSLSQAAVDYAYQNGVAFLIDSSDLNSFHHNQPNTLARTFAVHALEYDGSNPESSTTFLNFHPCSNYGSNIPGSVPASACASEAVANFAGMMGLAYSAALQANIPPSTTSSHIGDPQKLRRLSTEEAYQISINAMDDLYDPADATNPTTFPTKIGWDQRFGYGRVNARRMVDLILDGRIPPEVELRSPRWWDTIDPDRRPMITVDGRVMFRNAAGNKFGDSIDWVLEWAPGVEPDDKDYKTIAHAEGMTQGMDGPLGTWDVSQLHIDNPIQPRPDVLVNRYMVTMRLRAIVHSVDGKLEGLKGEARRAVFIHRDPEMVPGWPIYSGVSGESSPKMFDLDGDGKRELILADASGTVHAYTIDGKELPGWPVRTKLASALAGHTSEAAFTDGKIRPDLHATILATPAIGDVDGDGKPDVVVADFDGNLYVWHADGSMAKGWPQTVDRSIIVERGKRHHPAGVYDGVFASPVLADFDGDKVYEIVIADMLGEVTVWKGDGTRRAGWPVRVWDLSKPDDEHADQPRQLNRIMTTPAVGDLNKDGIPDIVVGTNEDYDNQGRLYAIDGKTGTYLPGWPVTVISVYVLPMVGTGVQSMPSLADLDGDGVPEIVTAGIGNAVRIFTATGQPYAVSMQNARMNFGKKSPSMDSATLGFIAHASFGDLDDDGVVDLIAPTVGVGVPLAMAAGGMRHDLEHHLSVWDTRTGQFKEGYPTVVEDYMLFHNPLVLDVDGDGHSEVVYGTAGYFIHAQRVDGSEATGFPKFTGQWNLTSPAVGDMDGDGKLEMASATREGWVYLWHLGGSSTGRIDWESYHHDARNTGNFATALDQGKGPPSCTDGVKNGVESDLDCGGICGKCANGKACTVAADCVSARCVAGFCLPAAPKDTGCGCSVGGAPAAGGGALAALVLIVIGVLARRRRACQISGS